MQATSASPLLYVITFVLFLILWQSMLHALFTHAHALPCIIALLFIIKGLKNSCWEAAQMCVCACDYCMYMSWSM